MVTRMDKKTGFVEKPVFHVSRSVRLKISDHLANGGDIEV
jgi:hypothetical protein